MGDYQLNGDFSEFNIQGLVASFKWFLYECCIRVDLTYIIMYGSGHSFLQWCMLILLSSATQPTTICLDHIIIIMRFLS